MKARYKWIFVFLLFSVAAAGCSLSKKDDQNTIAYIKQQKDSKVADTFNALSLGTVFDFQLELPHADTSWVQLWVEGYSHGKKIQSSELYNLSFGLNPSEVSKGPMGLGIVDGGNNETFLKLYAPGASGGMKKLQNIIQVNTASMWGYAIGDKEMKLKSGETRILAFYRQRKSGEFQTMDPYDEKRLKEMMQTDDTLLLLLIIKVDQQDHL